MLIQNKSFFVCFYCLKLICIMQNVDSKQNKNHVLLCVDRTSFCFVTIATVAITCTA